jgi:hypothetical protein
LNDFNQAEAKESFRMFLFDDENYEYRLFASDLTFREVLPVDCGPNGGLETACNDVPSVPLPVTLPMLMSGVLGLGFIGRRRSLSRNRAVELS